MFYEKKQPKKLKLLNEKYRAKHIEDVILSDLSTETDLTDFIMKRGIPTSSEKY